MRGCRKVRGKPFSGTTPSSESLATPSQLGNNDLMHSSPCQSWPTGQQPLMHPSLAFQALFLLSGSLLQR